MRAAVFADQRDLLTEGAEFADDDVAGVQRGAEIGGKAEIAPVDCRARREAGAAGGPGADDARLVRPRREAPSRDDFVPDVFVDLAAVLRDRGRQVGEHGVKKIEKARSPEALGGRRRGAQVDEQKRALFDARAVVAAGDEGDEHIEPEQVADGEHQVADEARSGGEDDVADLQNPNGARLLSSGTTTRLMTTITAR